MNPIDVCRTLNILVLPEFYLLWLGAAMYLLTLNWVELLFSLPLAAYNAYQMFRKQHYYDPTQAHRVRSLVKKRALLKLAFFVLLFFWSLYRLVSFINSSVDNDQYPDKPWLRHHDALTGRQN